MNTLLTRIQPFLHLACRLFLGYIFLSSGWEKLQHLTDFYQTVISYKVLPDQLAYFYAVCLPWLELFAGAYLILGLFVRFTASLSSLLTLSFIIAISIALATGNEVDCGCYINGKSDPVSVGLLLRDIGLLMLCGYLIWKPKSSWTIDAILQPNPTPQASH